MKPEPATPKEETAEGPAITTPTIPPVVRECQQLRAEVKRLEEELEARAKLAEDEVERLKADTGWAHAILNEAGFPDRQKIGEDAHGNEDFMHIGIRARLKALVKERDDLKASAERAESFIMVIVERTMRGERYTLDEEELDRARSIIDAAKGGAK